MKTLQDIQAKPRFARGFSLVEILTVIAIILVLATIIIGALGAVKKTQAKKETSVRLARLKLGIETYASDNNGQYPIGDDALSGPVYEALSGDFTGNGISRGQEPEGEIYWPELLNLKSGLVRRVGGKLLVVDAYLNSFRYRSGVDLQGEPVPEARNPLEFDAWSVGADGLPNDPNVDSNLQSDETKDDIWK